MKNDSLKELKPVYIHELYTPENNRVSFIDITLILIKRKIMITAILAITIITGVLYALQKPTLYKCSTSIEIGSQIINGTTRPFEAPETLLAKLNYSFIPLVLNKQQSSKTGSKSNFNIESIIPTKSRIIILSAKVKKEQTDTIVNILNNITRKAIQDHSRIFQSIKTNLETKLNQTIINLKLLKNEKNNVTERAVNQDLIKLFEDQLVNLHNTRQILPPIKSINPAGGSRKTIIVISAFSGIFLGIFAAFFTEFIIKVKQKMAMDKL